MVQNAVATSLLISLSRECKTLTQLKQVHAYLLKSLLPQNPSAIAPLLSVAATSSDRSFFSYARLIFNHLAFRNTFMYNTMIRGYVQANSPIPSLLLYLDMLGYGFEVNKYTFPPVIKACTVFALWSKVIGRLVHAHVVKFGFGDDPFVVSALIEFYTWVHDIVPARLLFDKSPERDVVMWTAMIDGHGKIGDIENARLLFEEMPQRNTISWSAIMAAYSRVSDFKEVLSLFRRMQKQGCKPNESVLVTVLTACAHLGALTQGLWIHSYVKRYNLESNTILATALVDMYCKCGYVESAISVFEGIRKKDVGAWNAMISGVALCGDVKKSLELFDQMTISGTHPTETTFVALLSACTHSKMVKKGLELFDQMSTIYGVEPQFEHCACVVDLLARAGMVQEAEKFIEEKMGGLGGGDANVWGALLGACRIYENVDVGNRVWKKLAEMGIQDCGTHVLSYNMYKEAGWDVEAARVRKFIAEAGLRKKPGCSVIEVNGVAEEFLAGDLRHPLSEEMYRTLDSFSRMINLEVLCPLTQFICLSFF